MLTRRRLGALGAGLVLLPVSAVALAPSPAVAAAPSCHGHRATIVGTDKRDTIHGTRHADVIVGLGADDVVDGRGGDDIICGNGQADVLRGGRGHDRLYGGSDGGPCDGNPDCDSAVHGDTLSGGPGDDLLNGGLDTSATATAAGRSREPDHITYAGASRAIHVDLAVGTATGQGRDRLVLRGGWTEIVGSSHDDDVTGGPEVDRVDPGDGDDAVTLGPGDDVVTARSTAPQADSYTLGRGLDTLTVADPDATVSVIGGTGDDRLSIYSAQPVTLDAGPGEDYGDVSVSAGAEISGGPGSDAIALAFSPSGAVPASYDATTGVLTLVGGGVVHTSMLDEYIFEEVPGGFGNSTDVLSFTGSDGSDHLWSYGYPLDAHMLGGDDQVLGSLGPDVVDGGAGTDYVNGVDGIDTCTNVELGPC
jgi:Ca2+-binding RTX toxin-like protein